VAVERRADVPPFELGSLQRHQQIVERIAAAGSAILPVRFGTLLTTDDIAEALSEREGDLAEAFALVRGRRQMTWRLRPVRAARTPAVPVKLSASSGAEYLRNAARASESPPLPAFRKISSAVGRLAVAERYQARTATLPDALYHLVDEADLDAYVKASSPIQRSIRSVSLSGPWAPYAFVPEVF
jgi:hypothetical protein